MENLCVWRIQLQEEGFFIISLPQGHMKTPYVFIFIFDCLLSRSLGDEEQKTLYVGFYTSVLNCRLVTLFSVHVLSFWLD